MTRAGQRPLFDGFAFALDGHHLGPSGAVAGVGIVIETQGDGAGYRFGKADAGIEVYLVAFELGAAAASETQPAARQVLVDVGSRKRDAGRDAFDDADERFPVRFPRSQINNHIILDFGLGLERSA